MKSLNSVIFISLLLTSFNTFALEPIKVELSSEMEEAKQLVESELVNTKIVKEKYKILEDEELNKFLGYIEMALEENAKCFMLNDDINSSICILSKQQELAETGNPISQHQLGNIYEHMGKKDKAIEWYEKAMNNPECPDHYKAEVKADLDRINGI